MELIEARTADTKQTRLHDAGTAQTAGGFCFHRQGCVHGHQGEWATLLPLLGFPGVGYVVEMVQQRASVDKLPPGGQRCSRPNSSASSQPDRSGGYCPTINLGPERLASDKRTGRDPVDRGYTSLGGAQQWVFFLGRGEDLGFGGGGSFLAHRKPGWCRLAGGRGGKGGHLGPG